MVSVSRGKLVVVLLVGCQLLVTYCSKPLYPDSSFQNIKSRTEKNQLRAFMDAGTEKVLNTHNTSPDKIINTARKYIGVPHCMGGKTMKCMDCSGLLVTVFAKYNIYLPHNSQEQARYGEIIYGMDKLLKGDLVFFIRSYETNNFITHSGIYIGNNEFIHTSSKKGVTITLLSDPYWNEKFIFGTRIMKVNDARRKTHGAR
jgi:cell wall-associated NlpC family hydrolase